jgi:hypothetical protein
MGMKMIRGTWTPLQGFAPSLIVTFGALARVAVTAYLALRVAANAEYGINQLPPPVNATFTATTGTLNDGTYYYRVSALTAVGETLASTETSLAVSGGAGANGVVVNWNAVPGATGYKVYGRTTAAEQLMATVGAVLAWTDNGSVTPSGALPAANTSVVLANMPAGQMTVIAPDVATIAFTAETKVEVMTK